MSIQVLGESLSGMGFFFNFTSKLYHLLITQQLLDYLPNILLAIVLGAILGFERRHKHKTAGVRTHMLVSASSALITLCGVVMTQSGTGDPTRLAGQIFAGIGFVGAGVILKRGIATSGVTTAATIFYTCGVGISCGFSMFALAIATTSLMIGGLTIISKYMLPNDYCNAVVVTCKQDQVNEVRHKLGIGNVLAGFSRHGNDLIDLTIQPKLTPARYQVLLEKLVTDPDIVKISTVDGDE